MVKYPNGKSYQINEEDKKVHKKNPGSANRGMNLENDINLSNEFYVANGIALIYKRPTPINIVKVDYSKGARIIDAYFEKQSTTDYNGVYKGRYIDFEAKMTNNKTSFPLSNIYKHQIAHLENVIKQGGIAFFIIDFNLLDKTYLLDAKLIIDYYKNGKRKSIPYTDIVKFGHEIKRGFKPRIDYIPIVDKIYKF